MLFFLCSAYNVLSAFCSHYAGYSYTILGTTQKKNIISQKNWTQFCLIRVKSFPKQRSSAYSEQTGIPLIVLSEQNERTTTAFIPRTEWVSNEHDCLLSGYSCSGIVPNERTLRFKKSDWFAAEGIWRNILSIPFLKKKMPVISLPNNLLSPFLGADQKECGLWKAGWVHEPLNLVEHLLDNSTPDGNEEIVLQHLEDIGFMCHNYLHSQHQTSNLTLQAALVISKFLLILLVH